jgi:hypothetical protein
MRHPKHFTLFSTLLPILIGQTISLIKFSNHQPTEPHVNKLLRLFNLPTINRRLQEDQCFHEYLEWIFDDRQPASYSPLSNSNKTLIQCPDLEKSCCNEMMLGVLEKQFRYNQGRFKRLRDFAENINNELLQTKDSLPKEVNMLQKNFPKCQKDGQDKSTERNFEILYDNLPTLTKKLDDFLEALMEAYRHVPCFLCDPVFHKSVKRVASTPTSKIDLKITINRNNAKLFIKPIVLAFELIIPVTALGNIAQEFSCAITDKIINTEITKMQDLEGLREIIHQCTVVERDEDTQDSRECISEMLTDTNFLFSSDLLMPMYEMYIIAFEFLGHLHKFDTMIMLKFDVDDFDKYVSIVPNRHAGETLRRSIFKVDFSTESSIDLSKYNFVLTDESKNADLENSSSGKWKTAMAAVLIVYSLLWW